MERGQKGNRRPHTLAGVVIIISIIEQAVIYVKYLKVESWQPGIQMFKCPHESNESCDSCFSV